MADSVQGLRIAEIGVLTGNGLAEELNIWTNRAAAEASRAFAEGEVPRFTLIHLTASGGEGSSATSPELFLSGTVVWDPGTVPELDAMRQELYSV